MAKTRERPHRNDTLQSGPGGDVAFGQDSRLFGEGGQTIERALEPGQDDKPHRNPERDESLPDDQHPSRSKR